MYSGYDGLDLSDSSVGSSGFSALTYKHSQSPRVLHFSA